MARSVDLNGLFQKDVPLDRRPVLFARIPDCLFGNVLPLASASVRRKAEGDPEVSRPGQDERATDVYLEPGAILDKYRIEKRIGRGGFGIVYRAKHLLLDMPVAIKLLRRRWLRSPAHDPTGATALLEEARKAAKISHPNVARVHDVSATPELTYIVMEYVAGRTLAQEIKRRGKLTPQATLAIGMQVVEGLRSAERQGLIHRDIKPANILVAEDGVVKIVDLGLACACADEGGEGDKTFRGRVGTPGYMAPEVVSGSGRADFRVDIYSLGVTLAHAVTGARPGTSGHDRSCIPPALAALLGTMLAEDPDVRPDSYEALFRAMSACQRLLGSIAPP